MFCTEMTSHIYNVNEICAHRFVNRGSVVLYLFTVCPVQNVYDGYMPCSKMFSLWDNGACDKW